MRYARSDFLNAIAHDTPLPMIVDAECGMPLDLGRWECLWDEEANDSTLNPDPENLPSLDPKDRFLLGDPSTNSTPFTNGAAPVSGSGTSTALPVHVPWLRKTEYISREGVQRASSFQEIKSLPQHIDVSRSAQLRDIEASFTGSNEPSQFDLSALRHPNKSGITAVESFEIFPDVDIWANAYDLFRFTERPGDKPIDVEDPRLDCAILRPVESDGDHFLAYHLTMDDESALEFKERRRRGTLKTLEEEEEEPKGQTTAFRLWRDFETVKIEQEVPNEFLLVIDNGDTQPNVSGSGEERPKGAYYKNIERKMTLKKRRTNVNETYVGKWEVVHISHEPMSKEELDEREELLAEVIDPGFLLNRDDIDADGEIDVDALGHQTPTGAIGEREDIMADIF
jgi:RNA polymerase II-associated factor 1